MVTSFSVERAELEDLLGPMPEPVVPVVEVLESMDCGLYRRDKLEYLPEAGERVRAYLLVPHGLSEPAPAVFCHHQHGGAFGLGKSEVVGLSGDPDQAFAAELAERGFVTFAPDAIGFEERNWAGDSADAVYFELTSRLIAGRTLMAKALHDIRAGIDVLTAQPEVDSTRLGFIGHSYGGKMALWAPSFDDRIRASVSHCGSSPYRLSATRDVGIQMELVIPGIVPRFDIGDVAVLAEDCAFLISGTDRDKWSTGAAELVQMLESHERTVESARYPGGHTFTREMRERAYGFLRQHLRAGEERS